MGRKSAYLTFALLSAGTIYLQKSDIASSFLDRSILPPQDIKQTETTKSPEPPKTGSIILGGDVMLARTVESRAVASGSWATPLAKIKKTLNSTDCRVVNLESPFKSNKPRTQTGSLVFAAKPEAIKALISANITAVSLGNNHITDQGLAGLQETKTLLSGHQIVIGGAGETQAEALEPQTIQCGNLKIGLVFATYGTNFSAEGVHPASLEDIIPSIQDIKELVDFTIVYAHWGAEYKTTPLPSHKQLAHKYIDAGADLVVGSHPHVLQPIELYNGKTIAYGLGNLVFDQEAEGTKTESILLKVNINEDEVNYEAIPIKIKNFFQPTIATISSAAHYLKVLEIPDWEWTTKR